LQGKSRARLQEGHHAAGAGGLHLRSEHRGRGVSGCGVLAMGNGQWGAVGSGNRWEAGRSRAARRSAWRVAYCRRVWWRFGLFLSTRTKSQATSHNQVHIGVVSHVWAKKRRKKRASRAKKPTIDYRLRAFNLVASRQLLLLLQKNSEHTRQTEVNSAHTVAVGRMWAVGRSRGGARGYMYHVSPWLVGGSKRQKNWQ
jgi:hypothetical protein